LLIFGLGAAGAIGGRKLAKKLKKDKGDDSEK